MSLSAVDSPAVVIPDLPEIPALLAESALSSAGGAVQCQRWHAAIDAGQLRQIRLQRGLSQERLAWKAGVSLTTIGKLERRRQASCHVRTLALIAAALDVAPGTLVLGNGAQPVSHG
jgi:DNA-binding XRE family transcriptional regulator